MSESDRPKLVDTSVTLLAALLIIGLLRGVFGRELFSTGAPLPLVYGILLVSNVLAAALLYKIWQGANWARILYAIVVAYGAVLTFGVLSPSGQQFSGSALLDISLLIAKLVSTSLLFFPASAPWFRRATQQLN